MHDPAIGTPDAYPREVAPGVLVADHFVVLYGYRVRRSKGRPDWLITYTHSGNGLYCIGKSEHVIEPGNIVLLAPNTPHDYATARGAAAWDFYWAHFSPHHYWHDWMHSATMSSGLHVIPIPDQRLRERMRQAFQRLIDDNHSAERFSDELAQNALAEVFILAARQTYKAQMPHRDARVEAVLARLTERLSEPLCVAELAIGVSLSPSRLAHLFKEEVGMSVIEMLLQLRLNQAARLLTFSERSVNQVAQDVGFASPFYFSRQFKRVYGVNPTAYRARTFPRSTGRMQQNRIGD